MKKYVLMIFLIFSLAACAAQTPNKVQPSNQIKLNTIKINNFDPEIDRYYKLGQFYQKVYISELIFDSMVETEKIKRSLMLREKLEKEKIIQDCQRQIILDPKTLDDASKIITFKATSFDCKISDPEKFYRSITQDSFLSYFKLRKKCGSYWVYMDLNQVPTWKRYFWYAYFIDKGYEPEFSDRLGLFVLAHFSTVEDALQLKKKYPEANLKVRYVICQDYLPEDKPKVINIRNLDGLELERLER